jgi:hypothetical protein
MEDVTESPASTFIQRVRPPGPRRMGNTLPTHPGLSSWRPRQDSNLRSRLRRAVLYPLSYGGQRLCPGYGPKSNVSVEAAIQG